MNPPAISQALSRGQIDCTFGPIDWMITLRLKDVVRVVMDYNLGQFHGLGWFVVNKASLKGLTPTQRAAIKKNLPAWNATYTDAYVQRAGKITDDLKKQGKVKFWKPTQDVIDVLARYKANEPAAVAADMRKRGVKDPERLINAHLATLKKWERIVDDLKWDATAIAQAMQREIYSKVQF